MSFVRIGKHVVNLENVTSITHTHSGGASSRRTQWIVSFVGPVENYLTIDQESEPQAYQMLAEWLDACPSIETMGGPAC